MFRFLRDAIEAVGDTFAGLAHAAVDVIRPNEQPQPTPAIEPERPGFVKRLFHNPFRTQASKRGSKTVVDLGGGKTEVVRNEEPTPFDDGGRAFDEPHEPGFFEEVLENQPSRDQFLAQIREIVDSAQQYAEYVGDGGDPDAWEHPDFGSSTLNNAYTQAIDYATDGYDGDDIVDTLVTELI